jgi:endonuclease/exonuclease/phosphatase family metal-dependent hydrolase
MSAVLLARRIALHSFVLLMLCGCACHERSVSAPSKPRPTGELRVMTFNLRVRTILDGPNIWDRRRELVVQRVRAFDPHLLGTQEGLASMEAFLLDQLSDYTFFGVGRRDGKRRGEMCAVFFKTARFELLDGGHFWLSTTPEKPGSRGWGAISPRMVTWVKLRPRDGRPTFYWFNTHFDAFSGRARTESAKLLRDRMAQIARFTPYVVTGDFNASPASVPYRTLLAKPSPTASPPHDVFRLAHPVATRNEGTFHLFTGWTGGRRIDWILASRHFQTIAAEIDRTRGPCGYPSDHFPVTATLRTRTKKMQRRRGPVPPARRMRRKPLMTLRGSLFPRARS